MSSSKTASRIERVQRSLNRVISLRHSSSTSLALSKLNKLLVVCRKLVDGINSDSNYLEKRRTRIREDIFNLNEGSYKQISKSILETELEEAIKNSEEYSYAPFADRLRMIPKDKRIVTLMLQGSKIRVTFEMNKVAGNYSSYLEAVRTARGNKGKTRGVRIEKAQKVYGGGSYPDLASRIWAEKIWGVFKGGKAQRRVWRRNKYELYDATDLYKGLYESIVHERLSNIKDVAPFWFLLENGNINMKSFGKGLATPVQKPTHFLSRSLTESNALVNETFQGDVDNAISLIEDDLAQNQGLIEWLDGIILQIETLIREIEAGATQVAKYEKEFYNKGIKQLEKAAKAKGIKGSLAVESKAIAERAREKALQMITGNSMARAELGTYFGVRIRPRTRKISKIIAKEEPYVIYPLDPNARQRLLNLAEQVSNEYKQTMAVLRNRR